MKFCFEDNGFFYHSNVVEVAEKMELREYEAAQIAHETSTRYRKLPLADVPSEAKCQWCGKPVSSDHPLCVDDESTRMTRAIARFQQAGIIPMSLEDGE